MYIMAGKFMDDYKEMVIELILEGKKSQTQIAKELGITRSTVFDWMANCLTSIINSIVIALFLFFEVLH